MLYGKYFNERGILWWTQLSAHVWYDTPEFRENFKKLLREWVIERRNDPAVIMWGLQNESKLPKDFAEECTRLIRQLDPTASVERPVTTCNGGEGTDWDVPQNWTGTYGGNPDTYGEDLKKQILVGEYGAWRTIDFHKEGNFVQNGPVSEDRFTLLMEKKIKLAEAVKDSVAGHFFWLLTSHDNPGRVQGGEGFREIDRIGPVNYKGLLTPWEEPTDAFYMFQSNYANNLTNPMVYIASHSWPNRCVVPGVKDSINVYSNCDEVELFNDIDNLSLGRKKKSGIGSHFIWHKINIKYNVLYAVGYIKNKPMARDTIILQNLAPSPNYYKLSYGAKSITKPDNDYNYLYRINCGGDDYIDENGYKWMADQSSKADIKNHIGAASWTDYFDDMPAAFASQRRTFSPIKGTKEWQLFQTFRYGKDKLSYNFTLNNGEYLVELYFIEPWLGIGAGGDYSNMRIFNVAFNNKILIKDLDIWKEAGTNKVLKKVIPVTVSGGKLNISFPDAQAGQALVSAIAIASVSKSKNRIYPAFNNIQLQTTDAETHKWLDIGTNIFLDKNVLIQQLPSQLFAADFIKRKYKNSDFLKFNVQLNTDLYIGIPNNNVLPTALKEFENTGLNLITVEDGKETVYNIYKKRIKAGTTLSYTNTKDWICIGMPASLMQPAYDLKSATAYKADVATVSKGVANQMLLGSMRTFIQTNNNVQIEWPVKTGVADIYSITLKYNWPQQNDINGRLELIDANGTKLVDKEVVLKNTKEGKWNLYTTNTGGMINAGNYKLRLVTANAKSLIISNVDIQ